MRFKRLLPNKWWKLPVAAILNILYYGIPFTIVYAMLLMIMPLDAAIPIATAVILILDTILMSLNANQIDE